MMSDEPDFDLDAMLQEEEEARYQMEMAAMEDEHMMDFHEAEERQELQNIMPSTPNNHTSSVPAPVARFSTPSSSVVQSAKKIAETVPARPIITRQPASFAESMQAERLALYGKDLSGHTASSAHGSNTLDVFARTAEFITRTPFIRRLKKTEISAYLHETPLNIQRTHDTCVLPNGRRFFVYDRCESPTESTHTHTQDVLLGRNVFELIADAEKINAQAARRKQVYLEQRRESDMRTTIGRKREQEKLAEEIKSKPLSTLWVDKYAPQTFTQLLSLEKTNREVLHALKRWDAFVFKRKDTTHTNDESKDENELDTDMRPKKKVIMLCGPPGTGKTTLAHICAKHCGYRPVEINASDDRSPDQLRELLSRATQSSTLDSDKRPNCVVFDEADGMDGGKHALDMLLQVISAPLKREKGTAGGAAQFALTRPLICICNDQHAPVLRDLRKVSEVFVFHAPQEQRLVQRLKHICVREKIGVSVLSSTSSINSALSELVAATGLDIRSSINNLQFAAMKMREDAAVSERGSDLTSVIDAMMKMGLKDDQLDCFQIWQRVFTKPVGTGSDEEKKESSGESTKQSLAMQSFDAMVDHGEFPQLLDGMHENMFSLSLSADAAVMSTSHVAHMHRFAFSCEWLSQSDHALYRALFAANVFTTSVSHHEGGVQVMNYVALAAPAVHVAHAVPTKSRVRLEWPRRERDAFYARVSKENVLQSVRENSVAGVWAVSQKRMTMDIIPFFVELIRPRCRPVPFGSLSVDEQNSVLRVAEIMETSGFSYVPTVVQKNTFSFKNNTHNNNTQRTHSHTNTHSKGSSGSSLQKDYTSLLLSEENVEMVLEPNVELLVEFTDFAARERDAQDDEKARRFSGTHRKPFAGKRRIRNHVVLSEDVKNLIYTEQRKLAIFLKSEQKPLLSVEDVKTETEHNAMPVVAEPMVIESEKEIISEPAPIDVQTELPETVKTKRSGNFHSFFKRPASEDKSSNKKIKTNDGGASSAPQSKKKSGLSFKFNEGFSNAVKRSVYVRDFL